MFMNFCPNCGSPCDDSMKFCPKCGNPLKEDNDAYGAGYDQWGSYDQNGYGAQGNGYAPNDSYAQGHWGGYRIIPRSIPMCIVFSIISCGIYALYWMAKLNDEINQICKDPYAASGGMVVLYSILTCGIYGIYWSYKMGEKCDWIKNRAGGNSNVIYLVVSLFGLIIINYCMMQDTINGVV